MASRKRKAVDVSGDPVASPPAEAAPGKQAQNQKGIARDLLPMTSVSDMFYDMLGKAKELNGQFGEGETFALTVATVCSGTDAPLTALNLIQEAARDYGQELLVYQHQFSCEVEPFKQAFIRRNHDPPVIFRNVIELGADGAKTATDASGSLKDIPSKKLDMLIAGTSCVDFSTLNSQKDEKTTVNAFKQWANEVDGTISGTPALDPEFQKAVHKQLTPEGLMDLGESMTTFLSTLSFIMQRRPRIVILENVQTCPWKAMENFWLRRAGYYALHTKVDSKQYYLPQDRTRGYLVALDAEAFGPGVEANVAEIMQMIRKLQRKASSSVAEFLVDEDAADLLQARAEIGRYGAHGKPKEGDKNHRAQVDWDHSKLRHDIYAQQWNLNTVRRFSNATLSHGRVIAISPPARSWIEYWTSEVPRVIDLFDNLFEQLLTRTGCDMRFKEGIFNVSQNLDRIPVNIAKFGLAPIITPCGMPTITNLARPLIGVECLALQGIPKNRLLTSGETERELRDLAGNAMTVTVVGAAILATLMTVGHKLVGIHKASPCDSPTDSSSDMKVRGFWQGALEDVEHWNLGDFGLCLFKLRNFGRFRVCHCPRVGSHKRDVFRCEDCGMLACQLCKGNPSHTFAPYEVDCAKFDIGETKAAIQKDLPAVFSLKMRDSSIFDSMLARRVVDPVYWETVKTLLLDADYYFSNIEESKSLLTVEYHAERTIARLIMTKAGEVDWFIYPLRTDRKSSKFVGVQEYSTPIAKGSIGKQTGTVHPDEAVWSLWEPVKRSLPAVVREKDDGRFVLACKRPAYQLPQYIHIENMGCGTWVAKPRCGTAEDSLFIREDLDEGQRVYLFKDVHPTGHPQHDKFVICKDVELAETRQYRGDEVKVDILRINDMTMGAQLQLSVPGYWHPTKPINPFQTCVHARKSSDYVRRADSGSLASWDLCCEDVRDLTLLEFGLDLRNFPLPQKTRARWNADPWYVIPDTQLDEFFQAVSFATNLLEPGDFFPDSGEPVKLCDKCCVEPPTSHWIRTAEGKQAVTPWEDQDETDQYDSLVKTRPKPFTARVRLAQQPDGDWRLMVNLAVSARTLASRAASNLAYDYRPRSFGSAMLTKIETSYQVQIGDLDGVGGPNVRFGDFYAAIPTTDDSTGLRNPLPSGSLNIDSFQKKDRYLRDDQKRSVRWMIARETKPAPYLETENEEQFFPAWNMRIVGRASFPNDGEDFCCRGGVVAHEIGYGKTVVTIALLELRRAFDKNDSVARREAADKLLYSESEDASSESKDAVSESKDGFFHLTATLVIVPDHIITQWEAEFKKFGSSDIKILVVRQFHRLKDLGLKKLEEADVIIVAASFFRSPSYTKELDRLTVDRTGAGRSDREVEARYRDSLQTIRKVVKLYKQLDEVGDDELKVDWCIEEAEDLVAQANTANAALAKQFVWTGNRKDVQKNQAKGRGKKPVGNTPKGVDAPEGVDGAEEKGKNVKKRAGGVPLWKPTKFLESFSFARVIVDEFSYDNAGLSQFFTNCLANAKWLLSGTPRCGNLADIVKIGRLLSVHVARADPCIPRYLDPIISGPVLTPTAPTEEYRLRASHLRSHNFVRDRHRNAETFVKHFMRQDKTDNMEIAREHKVIFLEMPPLSRIAYGGLYHDVALANGNLFNLPLTIRSVLGVDTAYSFTGDTVKTGQRAANLLLAQFAAMPMTAKTLGALLGSSEVAVINIKSEMKIATDKMLWLCHRVRLINPETFNRFDRYQKIITLVSDIFTSMADARDSWNKWPMAPYGGRDAFYKLAKALYPSTAFRYQGGGIEHWREWRYVEAQTFWPDWYDLPEEYIDQLAEEGKRAEILELATDAMLLSISHPLGRSLARTGDERWLKLHSGALGRIMDRRMRLTFMEERQASAAEQARAGAVRVTMKTFTNEQLVQFLKDCIKEKLVSFDPTPDTVQSFAEEFGKPALQEICLSRNLRYAESTSAEKLAEIFFKHLEGKCKPGDYIDKRGNISPRTEFPIPNRIHRLRGTETEATLEELTQTYLYFRSCQRIWIEASRRHRLYRFMEIARRWKHGEDIEIWCGACMRRQVCARGAPGFVVIACGHWLCEEHATKIPESGGRSYCPSIGCGAPCGLSDPPTIKLMAEDMFACPDIWDAGDAARLSEGGKVTGIVSLIVREIPDDDKVVIFTYLADLAKAVQQALRTEGIDVLSMIHPEMELDDALVKFKKGKTKVLILDPTAEHAAGSNLPVANHVIFASPLLEEDKFIRQMHYKQAVGRCLRQGQTKKVSVYSFVTKGTIDEEFHRADEVDKILDQLKIMDPLSDPAAGRANMASGQQVDMASDEQVNTVDGEDEDSLFVEDDVVMDEDVGPTGL